MIELSTLHIGTSLLCHYFMRVFLSIKRGLSTRVFRVFWFKNKLENFQMK